MQCHSQTVGHKKDVMRLPFTKCAMSLTPCWSQERCDESHETALHKTCNVTHLLLVIGNDVMSESALENVQCHSLAVGHRKRCDELE